MKLVMTLLVRDEEDILEANIRYHLSRGVDYIIATDNRSNDSTSEILLAHAREGHLEYRYEAEDDYRQSAWVTRMARRAATKHGADWVINNDADEFWWPEEGDLKTALASVAPAHGCLTVPRFNFVPRPQRFGGLFDRMVFREAHSRNHLGEDLPPKVAHRSHRHVRVGQGNHTVEMPGLGTPAAEGPITIFHFPVRTFSQFLRKITNGGAANERNPDGNVGQTWRLLYRMLMAGALLDVYTHKELPAEAIEAGLRDGTHVFDTRLLRALQELGCA